jgi:hypothetical protein
MIPIVFVATNPAKAGLIESYNRTGGNAGCFLMNGGQQMDGSCYRRRWAVTAVLKAQINKTAPNDARGISRIMRLSARCFRIRSHRGVIEQDAGKECSQAESDNISNNVVRSNTAWPNRNRARYGRQRCPNTA